MPRKRTGTIERRPDGSLRARVTVSTEHGPKRVWLELDPKLSETKARQTATELAERLARRELTSGDYEQLVGKRSRRRGVFVSVDEFWEQVYSPTRSNLRVHTLERSIWRTHVKARLGHLNVRTFSADDLRAFVAYVDARLADKSARFSAAYAKQVWGTVARFCKALLSSKNSNVRIRRDNPAMGVEGPNGGVKPNKQWLFPDELEQLLACNETPLALARFVAVQVYTFSRPGETLGLEWERVDLQRGIITIDRAVDPGTREERDGTKTGDVRVFPIPTCLLPTLHAMHAEQGGTGRLFVDYPSPAKLRALLRLAGVTRPALHERQKTSRPVRTHDLRATGISYLAMAGVSDEGIRERAGHDDFDTTLGYIRRGKLVASALRDPFSPLPRRLVGTIELPTDIARWLEVSSFATGAAGKTASVGGKNIPGVYANRQGNSSILDSLDDSGTIELLREALIDDVQRAAAMRLLLGKGGVA